MVPRKREKAFEGELPSTIQETVDYLLGTVVNTVVGERARKCAKNGSHLPSRDPQRGARGQQVSRPAAPGAARP